MSSYLEQFFGHKADTQIHKHKEDNKLLLVYCLEADSCLMSQQLVKQPVFCFHPN